MGCAASTDDGFPPGRAVTAPRTPHVPGRPLAFCLALVPRCPRCNEAIHGAHPANGATWMQCRSRRRHGPNRETFRRGAEQCGQWVYVVSAAGGVCVVVPVTHGEHRQYGTDDDSLRRSVEVLRGLGLVVE